MQAWSTLFFIVPRAPGQWVVGLEHRPLSSVRITASNVVGDIIV